MAELAEFFISIGSKFDPEGINKAVGKLEAFSKKTKNIAAGFKIAGAALTAFAGAGVLSIIKLTDSASSLEETTSKFETVFEGQEKVARKWAKTLVKSYGVSTEQAKRFLGSIQDLLVPMGMNAVKAGELANEVVKLSIDLGSFNNLPTEKVMLDIQSALVGNFETMKKYGVVLNATRVEQKIMNEGWVDSKDQITQSMKAQAAYNLIVDGSTAALGDFNRTSEGYANQVKIMSAGIEDMKARLGEKLIPTMKQIVGLVNELTGALQKLSPETIDFVAKTLLITTAIAGILGPFALFIGFLPQMLMGLIKLKGAMLAVAAAAGTLRATILAHPILAIAAALSIATIALLKYLDATQDAADATINLGKTTKDLIALQEKELTAINSLLWGMQEESEARTELMSKATMLEKSLASLKAKLKREDIRGIKKVAGVTESWIEKHKQLYAAFMEWKKEGDVEDRELWIMWLEEQNTLTLEQQEFLTELKELEHQEYKDKITEKLELMQTFTDATMDLVNGYYDLKSQRIRNELGESLEAEEGRYESRKAWINANIKDEQKRNEMLDKLEEGHAASQDNLRAASEAKERAYKKKMKKFQIAEAIMNTAVGATKALAQGGGILGIVLAAMVVAAGAMQISMIKAQKFAKGAFIRQPTLATFAEEGPEIALPLKHPNTIEALSMALKSAMGGGGGNIFVTVPAITSRQVAREYGDIIGDEIMRKVKRNRKL